jgi:uncharacterized protein with FMN-binding domain
MSLFIWAAGGKRRAVIGAAATTLSSLVLAACGLLGGTATLRITLPLKNGQYTGQDITTPYGDVQVQITVSNGRVTDVQAPLLPNDRTRSVEINQAAGPILHDEALKAASAQPAQIDTVSGATYTSEAYVQSLQSAIDSAHP